MVGRSGIRLRSHSGFKPKVRRNLDFSGVLNTSISIRTLLRHSIVVLAFIIVFSSVFFLGRLSVSTGNAVFEQGVESKEAAALLDDGVPVDDAMSQEEAVVEEVSVAEEDSLETESQSDSEAVESDAALSDIALASNDSEESFVELEVENDDLSEDTSDVNDMEESFVVYDDRCVPKPADFDFNYSRVTVGVSNFQKDVRGDNWASVTALKLTVINAEPCTIINPAQIKIKLNNHGKGSVWWDEETFLPDSFKNIRPGQSVSEVIPVHVSYSDINAQKDFKLTVFDEYDISMATYKDTLVIP